MTDAREDRPAPTLAKVLDDFLVSLRADDLIDDAAAGRLDALLRKGKALKPEEIDAALAAPPREGSQ